MLTYRSAQDRGKRVLIHYDSINFFLNFFFLRNCIGQKFAAYEEKVVLSTILRNFRIRSVDKRNDVKMINELVLRPIGGINVTLEKR